MLELIHDPRPRSRWLRLKVACEYLDMSRKTLLKYVHMGLLRGKKVGVWKIDRQSIEDFMEPDTQNDRLFVDVKERMGL